MEHAKSKFTAFAALCLAIAPLMSHAQDASTDPAASNTERAALQRIMSPAHDPSMGAEQIGAESAARRRAALERFMAKTPGQAAHDAGAGAMAAAAKAKAGIAIAEKNASAGMSGPQTPEEERTVASDMAAVAAMRQSMLKLKERRQHAQSALEQGLMKVNQGQAAPSAPNRAP